MPLLRKYTCLFIVFFAVPLFGQQGRATLYTSADGLPATKITSLALDANGLLWIGTAEGGISTFDGRSFSSLRKTGVFKDRSIYRIRRDAIGNMHVWTSLGTYIFTGDKVRQIGTFEPDLISVLDSLASPCGGITYDIQRTAAGELWYATDKGLCRSRAFAFKRIGYESGVIDPRISAVDASNPNDIYFATDDGLVYNATSTGIKRLSVEAQINDIHISGDQVWLAGDQGISVLRDSKIDSFNIRNLTDAVATVLYPVSNERFLIGMTSGLLLFELTGGFLPRMKYFDVSNGFVSDRVVDIEHFGSRVYIATKSSGLFFLELDADDKEIIFKAVIDRDEVNLSGIVDMASTNNHLWVALESGALVGIGQDGQITPVPKSVLIDDLVKFLGSSDGDVLFVGSPQGLQVLSANQELTHRAFFGQLAGFQGKEAKQRGFSKDGQNNLYFATYNGLVLSPAFDKASMEMGHPGLSVQSLHYGASAHSGNPFSDSVWVLNAHKPDVEVHLHHIDFIFPEYPAFAYRLEENDGDWSAWSGSGVITIEDLTRGNHTIAFRAMSNNGVVTDTKRVHVFVKPPFWMQRETMLFAAAILLILLLIIYRTITANRVSRSKRLEEEQILQERLATLEQQTLQLQISPHFLSNALNALKQGINIEDIKGSKYHLSKYAALMRMILEHSRANWVSLEEEEALLQKFVDISALTFNKTLSIDFDFNTIPKSTQIPPLVLQPIVENAIKHGFKGRQSGSILIKMRYVGRNLKGSVIDNGVGLDVQANEGKSQGSSMIILKERLEKINRHKPASVLDIHQRDEGGTRVDVIFPYLS